MNTIPPAVLATSLSLYPALLRLLSGPPPSSKRLSASIRIVSTIHSSFTTLCALYILKDILLQSTAASPPPSSHHGHHRQYHGSHPDDSQNILITTRSTFANALTAVETGYLLSAIPSLLREARAHKHGRVSKTMLAHHAGIGSALLVLQYYIVRGHERGILIIVMFILMNASTPLLNLRWYLKNFRPTANPGLLRAVDASFVVAFLLARVLLVPGIIGMYGRGHDMGLLDTWWYGLRRPCRWGTGALWAGNFHWWIMLVRGLIKETGSRA